MPRFSIIVPVYNVEQYLAECVESVLAQTFTDWEMILVDDGSPDNCPRLCDGWAGKDARIKVVHKKNGGASSARNVGIRESGGEYILFLDSDDFYNDKDALKTFDDKLKENETDVLIFGCTDFNMNTGKTIVSRTGYDLDLIGKHNYIDTLHYLLSSKMIPGAVYIFCSKRQLLNDNNIRFKEGIQDEDYDFVLSVFMSCKAISAIDNPFYSYRNGRLDSVTESSNIKMIYGIEYTVNKWIEKSRHLENNMIKNDLLNYIAFIYSTGFVISGRMDLKTRNHALKVMRKYRHVLKYGYWKKTRLARIAVHIMGMPLFSVLSALYFKLTHI